MDRTTYQAIALLARQERTRVRADKELTDSRRDAELKRLDGIAAILARTAAGDSSFFEIHHPAGPAARDRAGRPRVDGRAVGAVLAEAR